MGQLHLALAQFLPNNIQEEIMRSRVVITLKLNVFKGTLKKVKCRWIVQGFTDARLGDPQWRKGPTTVSEAGVKSFLCFATKNGWGVFNGDVDTALLRGVPWGEEENALFMKVPPILV